MSFPAAAPARDLLVDSHCHLDYYKDEELPAILARARNAGVGLIVTIGTRLHQAAKVKALCEAHAEIWGTVGIHPHNVAEAPLPTVEELVRLADHPKIIGIGESGLDYFYQHGPREVQAESFRRHIRAARAAGLPLAIHARDADADIARILAEEMEAGGPLQFLLHCFSSGKKLAEFAIKNGGYVSFSGILTFPKSEALREIARSLPHDRLMVETDAPFLAPTPYRGKRNEPAYVPHTAAELGRVLGLSTAEVTALTTANFRRLFSKVSAQAQAA